MTTALIKRTLGKSDTSMRALIKRIGSLDYVPETDREPFESLVRAVAHQQLHGKAAESILKRFLALFPAAAFPSPEQVLRKQARSLRAVGFSEAKVLAIRDIAKKTVDGVVPGRSEIVRLSDDEIISRLVQVRGVGRWTVEMLLIFQLGRPDVFPVDDFGVRKGFSATYPEKKNLKPKALQEYAKCWSPYRTYAALYFWRAADALKKSNPRKSSRR